MRDNRLFYATIAKNLASWILIAALPLVVLLGLNSTTLNVELISRFVLCGVLAVLAVFGTLMAATALLGKWPQTLPERLGWFVLIALTAAVLYLAPLFIRGRLSELSILGATLTIYLVMFVEGLVLALMRLQMEQSFFRKHGQYRAQFVWLPDLFDILKRLP